MCRVYLYLGEYAPDSINEHLDVLWKYVSNGADAKAICVAYLAGINNEAEFAQPVIKHRKIELAMRGKTERRNDVALMLGRKMGRRSRVMSFRPSVRAGWQNIRPSFPRRRLLQH